MGLSQITPPSLEPVTLDDAKVHLRLSPTLATGPGEDGEIERLIRTARTWCESSTGRQLITATWKLTLPAFQYTRPNAPRILLPRPPLQTVTSITYLDSNGTRQLLDPSIYVAHADCLPGYIRLAYNQTWPTFRPEEGSIEIIYRAGYGDGPDNVPDCARSAMLVMVAHLWEFREPVLFGAGTVQKIPSHFEDILTTMWAPEF